MNRQDYQTYLASREWALKREAVRERSGDKCERCLVRRMTAVHHMTYERVGAELLTDLQAICDPCHEYLSGKRDVVPHVGMVDAQGRMAINSEKAATTIAIGQRVCGVKLSSRYDKQHEYDAMIAVVRSLPPNLTRKLRSMFCDSKATSVYTVEGELSQDDLYVIGEAFVEHNGGHNGIFGPNELYVDPDWGVT